jgi:hypothetical protein
MVDMEELVDLHVVMNMVEKVMDKVKDVMNEYKLDLLMMVLLNQVYYLKFVLFAIVRHDQIDLVKNIELVEQHHIYPKKVDIVDQVMNNNLDHYLNMDHYRKKQLGMMKDDLT